MDDEDTDVNQCSETPDVSVLVVQQRAGYLSLMGQQPFQLQYDDDPLVWWNKHQSFIRDLADIARCYLGIQAISCATERLFSKAAYIVRKYRTCQRTNNVGMLTFLAPNSHCLDLHSLARYRFMIYILLLSHFVVSKSIAPHILIFCLNSVISMIGFLILSMLIFVRRRIL